MNYELQPLVKCSIVVVVVVVVVFGALVYRIRKFIKDRCHVPNPNPRFALLKCNEAAE